MTWLELWEGHNTDFIEPFNFCLCTLSRSLSRARSRAISWATRVVSEQKLSHLSWEPIVSVITCGVFLFQVFQDIESFVKKALFTQRLPFPKHGFIVIFVLCEGLLEMVSDLVCLTLKVNNYTLSAVSRARFQFWFLRWHADMFAYIFSRMSST